MGDVLAQQPVNVLSSSRQTIQIVVVDERGSRANCKLYKGEKLSEILKKYNTQLHTNYDTIMLNNSPIPLHQTPALLGLDDGQTLQFCKSAPQVAPTNPFTSSTYNKRMTTPNLTTSMVSVSSKDNIPAMIDTNGNSGKAKTPESTEQKISNLEKDLEIANSKCLLLQNQVVNLENKLSEEQEKTQCRICFERHRDTVIFPCLHFSYCGVCLDGVLKQHHECPSCRGRIAGTLHIQIG